ncbi:MAG: HAMP domain-containing protein [Anaerolineales bacterium]|nr:HAMP domain-containing protein [Anaerolineales bacterium]
MSLRVRLTLFYTTVLGVVFILFGVAVYTTTSIVLVRQIDQTLEKTVADVLNLARFDSRGQFGLLYPISFDPRVILQVWDTGQLLLDSTNPNLSDPINPAGIGVAEPEFSDVWGEIGHYRVLSVPVQVETDTIGFIQAGINLAETDTVRQNLLQYLIIMGVIAISVAGFLGWASIQSAISPLATMTETALKITHADDLSMRIPQQGSEGDEIGKLILAFNQTLERLEDLFNTQRRFLTDVGHELRTPLTVIKGNVGVMRKENKGDEELLNTIENEIDRLTRLVENLLLLARAESGKLPLDSRPVDLDTVLLEVFQQVSILATNKKEIQIGEFDQVQIIGDRDRIKQVFLNLTSNAVKYTQAGGKILVSLSKIEGWAKFVVTDNGPGIAPQDLPHIFERFYRAEKSRSRDPKDEKGFGLGLSIAYWIVRNHGGRIEVASTIGEGTTFSVWLPVKPA